MEQILNYFDTIPSLHRSIILVGGLTFFWILEGALPLVKFNYNKWSKPNSGQLEREPVFCSHHSFYLRTYKF